MADLLLNNDPVNKRLLRLYKALDTKSNFSLTQAERELARAYKASLETIQKELNRLYNKYADDKGAIPPERAYKYDRLSKKSKQISGEIAQLNGKTKQITTRQIKNQFKETYYSVGYINESTFKVNMGFATLNKKAVEAVVVNPLSLIKWPDSSNANAVRYIQSTRSILTQGVSQGWSNAKTARALRDATNKSFSQSVQIVRTEAHRSRELGNRMGFDQAQKAGEDLGIELERIWAHGGGGSDPRSDHVSFSGSTPNKDGDFVLPSGNKGPAPGSIGAPEDDINCTCFVIEQAKEYPIIPRGETEEFNAWRKRKGI